MTPKIDRKAATNDDWWPNIENGITYIFHAWFAMIICLIPAMLGDFEAFFWYMKSQRDLIPPTVAYQQELYLNRQNGIIVSFRNTSYYPDKYALNWTNFTDFEPNLTNGSNSSNGTNGTDEFDINGDPKVEAGNPRLQFLTDFE